VFACSVFLLLALPAIAAAGTSEPPPPTAPAGAAPIAVDDAFHGAEGSPCIELRLGLNDALPSDRPIDPEGGAGALAFVITMPPLQGDLYFYDASQAYDRGEPAIANTRYGTGHLCYVARRRFFHGLDTLKYELVDPVDGVVGRTALVHIGVADVNEIGEEISQTRNEPTGVAVDMGDGEATVSWGADDPSATFVVTPFRDGEEQPSVSVSGKTSVTLTGLTNGTPYAFSVRTEGGLCTNGLCTTTSGTVPTAPLVPGPEAPTSLSLQPPAGGAVYGEPVSVSVTLSSPSGEPPQEPPVQVEALGGSGDVAASCLAPLDDSRQGACDLDGLHAGAYSFRAAWESPTYLFADASAGPLSLEVAPAPLRVAATSAQRPAGQPNPPLSATFAGFVAGDGPATLAGRLECTTTATAASPPGDYPVVCTGLSSSDYDIVFEPGTLTVTGAPVEPASPNKPAPGGEAVPRPSRSYKPRMPHLVARLRAQIIVRGAKLRVPCRVKSAPLAWCAVKLSAGARGRRMKLAQGAATARTNARAVAVKISLTPTVRARLAARPAGLRIVGHAIARVRGQAGLLHARLRTRLLAARQTLEPPRAAMFEPSTAVLTASGRRWLRWIARSAAGVRRIVCTGHTAAVVPVETPFSRALARERAEVACAALRDAGLTAPMSARSAGKDDPRATNSTAAGRALNRRATITLLR
jgi:outer membrane protein OmpA-like peptidoglycan-associated protein